MAKRIRYTRVANVLTSNDTFAAGAHQVQVTIDLDQNSFQVKDVATGEVLKSGSEKTHAYVKKSAKAAVQSLGATFSDEKRVRVPNEKDPVSSDSGTAAA
jgi:hypothetical protein